MTHRGISRHLAVQIYTGIALTLIIAGAVFGAAFYVLEKQRYETLIDTVVVAADSIVRQYEATIANELFIEHITALNLIAREMQKTEDVVGTVVFGKDNTALVVSGNIKKKQLSPDDLHIAPDAPYRIEQHRLEDEPVLVYTKPIMIIGEKMGHVQLYYTLNTIYQKTRKAVVVFILLFLTLLISLFVIIQYLLNRLVIRPIQVLKDGMDAVQAGEMGKQIELATANEFGTLATAFNDMSEKNARMYDQLRVLNLELEQKVAERTAQLEKANKAKSDFLANMSHELRTPLTAVLGYARILLDNPGLEPDLREGLQTIQGSSEHLLTLINDILDVSKIEARHMKLHSAELHFPHFIDGITAMMRIKAEWKGISFRCDINGEMPVSISADEKRLRQVLINLIGNAVKFTETGGVVFKVTIGNLATENDPVSSGATDDSVTIRFDIEDTGVGIAPEKQQVIFHPFEQLNPGFTHEDGTGLGLAISRQLVSLMGGEVELESTPGVGSRFRFEARFPVIGEAKATAPELQPPVPYTDKEEAIIPPDKEELIRLYDLAMLGKNHNIKRIARKLEETDARYAPFAKRLQKMASAFEDKQILEFLAYFLENHP